MDRERISRLSRNIEQENEGKYNASFSVKSETDDSVWYDVNWNMYESNLHRAFTCECMDWQADSTKNGLCKHTIALCKKLVDEGRVPRHWFEEALTS